MWRLDAKLDEWREAGLLDSATADRIREHEESSRRPLLIWALTALGALAILLGAASLVAANWDEIPGGVRLVVHWLTIAGASLFHYWRTRAATEGNRWFGDARLFLIAGLGLAFLFHLEEVYDRDLPFYQPTLAWLIAFTPLLLGFGRTVATALGWMAMLAIFALATVGHRSDALGDLALISRGEGLSWAALLSLPTLAGLFALWRDGRAERDDFWTQIAALSLYWQFAMANYFFLWGVDAWPENADSLARVTLPLAAITALAAWPSSRLAERREAKSLVGMAAIAATLLLLSPMRPEGVISALIFLAAWAGIAMLALEAGWRQLFQGAVAIIALRLVVLTFELSDNLLGSGVGFILSGLALFAFASIAFRVGRDFAPGARPDGKDGA
jgi:uncharacterized membrane protein